MSEPKEQTPEEKAAERLIAILTPKANGEVGGMYPFWHAWALREAFLAGIAHARGPITAGITTPMENI